jgi:trimethylamine---corrinoid protein Co-methyltransferase
MHHRLEFLEAELVQRILDEAFELLREPGIKVEAAEARALLAESGATVDEGQEVARLPEALVCEGLGSVPRSFTLHRRNGEVAVTYGGDAVHFDPGSSGVHVLDPETLEHRTARTPDLLRLIQVAEQLPAYDAQSTAVVCDEVPREVGDIYRLYLVLMHSEKPVVTGAFSAHGAQAMIDMLALASGGHEALRAQPRAIFDVCPSPPLIWSEFGAQNLIDLARAGMPAEIVSMPLAGAAAPVTLLGAVVQHAAECLSGIAIHQLAQPGAPIVWGGAPAIFDMRHGTTPMGAVETAMIDAAYAQVGKSLGLPTHAYLGASDAKVVDAQAGLESGMTALVGALAGINMISGAGMLDFLACQSAEKLVIDAEAIAMVRRLLRGIEEQTTPLATALFAGIDFRPDFLKQKATRQLFRKEQVLPSPVIDRGSRRSWQEAGSPDTFARARARADELVASYERPALPAEQEAALAEMMAALARAAGMGQLPVWE